MMRKARQIVCAGLALGASCCYGYAFDVFLDTSLLVGHPAAPFYVEFQFNDGTGAGDDNNLVTVSDFAFGGGAAGPGGPITTGAAGGDLTGIVNLADIDFFNQFVQEFQAGTSFSFHVDVTTAIDPGPQPDQFSFAILDCAFGELPTTSPANALLALNIDGQLVVQTFAGSANGVLACTNGPGIPLPAPIRVPEPGGLALVALGGLWALRWRRGDARASRLAT